MPFTVAHALAVLPGVHARRALHLDPTCLVIGSMAPDVEYFVHGQQVGRFAHSLLGVAVWGIPVTLVLALVFHQIVKWPVLLASPASVTPVFAPPWRARWTAGAVVSVVCSAALGALTHVLWDAATHSDGLIVRQLPALATPYQVPGLGTMVLHRILLHASTLVGLAGVAAYLAWRLRRAPRRRVTASRGLPRIAFAGCVAAGVVAGLYRLERLHVDDLGSRIAAAISGALAGTVVASAIVRRAARRYEATVLEAMARE